MANVKALVDSGATDNFVHPNFAKRMKIGQRELDKPKNIHNIDDTTNRCNMHTACNPTWVLVVTRWLLAV
jgi:hypothetical protein